MPKGLKTEFLEIEKKIIDVNLEKSRLNRERSTNLLDKGLLLYFSFTFLAIVGFVNRLIPYTLLNLLIIMGILTLLIGAVPYIIGMSAEEKRLNELNERLLRIEKEVR